MENGRDCAVVVVGGGGDGRVELEGAEARNERAVRKAKAQVEKARDAVSRWRGRLSFVVRSKGKMAERVDAEGCEVVR